MQTMEHQVLLVDIKTHIQWEKISLHKDKWMWKNLIICKNMVQKIIVMKMI